jgi:hypothetical protein
MALMPIIFAEPHQQKKLLRVVGNLAVATICGLTFGFTAQGFLISMLSGQAVGARDFVVYWATGQQLAHHANPYDRDALSRIEHAAGLPQRFGALFMRNPPSTVLLVYPLGFLGLRVASVIWSLFLLLCFLASVYIVWLMLGKPKGHRHWIGYSFAPALVGLLNGQTSLFALLGLVIFLRLHRTHQFLAGLSLWLCLLKPHLFLPFGLVMLVWIVVTRSYRILLGAGLSIAASFAIAYHIDPIAWRQYSQMVHASGIQWEFIPCLSVLLRVWFGKRAIWLQYVPAVIACTWALIFYWRRRDRWNWLADGSLLMLVSIVAAPYCWLFDQCLAIPALMYGAYLVRSRNWVFVLAILSALIEIALFCNIWKPSAVYLWTLWSAPAWLIWYLVAINFDQIAAKWPMLRAKIWPRRSQPQLEPIHEAQLSNATSPQPRESSNR